MAEIEYATEARAERIRSSYDGPQDIAPPAPLHEGLPGQPLSLMWPSVARLPVRMCNG
jgi:hypothetical protein